MFRRGAQPKLIPSWLCDMSRGARIDCPVGTVDISGDVVTKPFRSPDVNFLDGWTDNGCNARPADGHSRLRELREGNSRGVIKEQPGEAPDR